MRLGGEWAPALSRTRRALFHFSLAPSAIDIPESATNATASGVLWRLEGDVTVEYPFLPNWSGSGSYTRGVEYIAVLREPVFRDAVRVGLSVLATERLDVSASAASSAGESALNQNRQRYDAYTGDLLGRISVTRSFALYGEYLYYRYQFHDLVGLAPGLPNRFDQHGVRVGVMLWARPVGR
jgi:hypothetical protein